MIIGLGLDLIDLTRITQLLERNNSGLEKLFFTDLEREQFEKIKNTKRKIEWVAGRMAAKEAFVKAVGTGFAKNVGFQEIEILSNPLGKPEVKYLKPIELIFPAYHSVEFFLTITHSQLSAGAIVVIQGIPTIKE
ncbi:holo-ACP synthase [Lysinibacillus sp. NPDC093712]|uniref:holo-ACP synthase n=1 Tax=Lysinibacillus sp. NPDC093712 TaxID=3390579 RepID=UPI003CFF0316